MLVTRPDGTVSMRPGPVRCPVCERLTRRCRLCRSPFQARRTERTCPSCAERLGAPRDDQPAPLSNAVVEEAPPARCVEVPFSLFEELLAAVAQQGSQEAAGLAGARQALHWLKAAQEARQAGRGEAFALAAYRTARARVLVADYAEILDLAASRPVDTEDPRR